MANRTITVGSGQTSAPLVGVAPGQRITLTPASGSAYLQYAETTGGGDDEIVNGVATWVTWPAGTVTAATSDDVSRPMAVRVVNVSGSCTLSIAEQSQDALLPSASWKSQQAQTTGAYSFDAVLLGDSITGRGNYGVTATSIAASGGLATVTATTHALFPGATFLVGGANEQAFNGIFQVQSRVDANTFTYQIPDWSVTAATGATISIVAQQRVSDRNWFEMANAAIGHPFRTVYNAGVSGETLANIYARFYRDALRYNPKLIQIEGGINDIQATTAGAEAATLTAMQGYYKSMMQQCVNAKITPLVMTITPLSSSAALYTAARGQMVLKFNAWLRELVYYQFPQAILFDAWAVCVNPTSATGNWAASYSSDGVHPTALAAQRMSQTLATLLTTYRYTRQQWVGSIFDSYDNDSSNPQIDPNPLNTGTTGTKSTAGAGSGTNTGSVPDNYTATWTRATTGAAVCAVTARSDGFGNDLVCTLTSVDLNDAMDVVQTASLHARVSAGDVLEAEANVVISSITNMSNISFAFEWTIDGNTYTQPAAIGTAASGQITDNIDFVLRTPQFTVPTGSLTSLKTRLKITFAGAGGATLKYGRHSIRRLIAPPTY